MKSHTQERRHQHYQVMVRVTKTNNINKMKGVFFYRKKYDSGNSPTGWKRGEHEHWHYYLLDPDENREQKHKTSNEANRENKKIEELKET